MSPYDSRTIENPESAMRHQPEAFPTSYYTHNQRRPEAVPLTFPIAFLESAKLHNYNAPQENPGIAEERPEPGTLPGFDSDAHRRFMRGLG